MSNTVNLAPGSVIPETGMYKCDMCGEGGMADFFLKKGLNTPNLQHISHQNNIKFFEAGKYFSECPTCGKAAGWTLVEENLSKNKESIVVSPTQVIQTKKWWEFWK